MIHHNWECKGHFWSECWLPNWGWKSSKDWVHNGDFNPLEDHNADIIKRNHDQSNDVVVSPHDPVWNKPKDINGPVEGWPEGIHPQEIG